VQPTGPLEGWVIRSRSSAGAGSVVEHQVAIRSWLCDDGVIEQPQEQKPSRVGCAPGEAGDELVERGLQGDLFERRPDRCPLVSQHAVAEREDSVNAGQNHMR
jgi:hypothetical protein